MYDDRDSIPATPRQLSYIAGLGFAAVNSPMKYLAPLLEAAGVELTDAERAGLLSQKRASKIITTLKKG